MANETFFPPITNLVALEDLPEELGFVKDGLADLLDNILYKDLQYSRSAAGDTAFYNLSIVSKKRIDIEIPGTGIFLVLNPSHDASTKVSEFPISLNYNRPIIAYVGSLDLGNFSFGPADMFELALKVLKLSERTLIDRVIAIFLNDVPQPVNTFVSQLNSYYGTSIPVPISADPVQELLTAMKNEPRIGEVGAAVFLLFILDNLDLSKSQENLNKFFSGLVQPDLETFMLQLLKPSIDASLRIGAGLEFPRNVLLPVDNAGNPLPDPEKVMLLFAPAEFYFSTSRGIGYNTELRVTLNHKAHIAQTGLAIELDTAKLDISRTTNITEADQDGRPKEFVGAYFKDAIISLPNFLNHDDVGSTARIIGRNMIIGTGGFSGTVGLEAKTSAGGTSPTVKANLDGGFEISLDNFFISFRQNTILSSSISGTLKIPGFKDALGNDAEVNIMVQITDGGNYSITLTEAQGIEAIEIPDILKFTISSLSIGEKNDNFFMSISGKIDFIADVPALGDILPKAIEIKKLIIWKDGSMEFEGGGITLPKAVTLEAGPVKFSVTAIHFGTHKQFFNGQERKYNYFGFDGGISLNPGGVDARGDGIKFYYTADGLNPFDSFLRVEGIGINLTIPGDATPEAAAVILKGYLAMRNADSSAPGSTEYAGAVSLTLPKVNIAGSAAMRLNPDVPAFLVDIGLELSVPILLGATGLGIYGFRGLVGQKYMPSKSAAKVDESDTWWYYYKSKEPNPPGTEGINFGKFEQKNGFSIGAGASLATSPDSGKTFSAKLFFMLGLPEVFLLQGQAAILKERIGLDDTADPPFSALIAISSSSVETAFGVNYQIPDAGNFKGDILTLQATLEMAFFYNNASGWFINLGRETPEEKRVQAKILSLFNGYAFLMLSSSGIKAGAGVSWGFKKSYGPVGIDVGAFLDIGGSISFKPVQIGGFIQMGGYAHINVFGFVLGFDVNAGLAAECPKPFIITGFFILKFKIKLFWFLKLSFNINVELTWVIDENVNGDPLPVIGAPADNYFPAIASNIMSREVFAVGYLVSNSTTIPAPGGFSGGLPVVPMDSYIDIEFLQAIKPGNDSSLDIIGGSRSQIAEHYKIVVPPEKGKSDQVHHEFTVESIKVLHWDEAQWQEYHIYEAVTAISSVADLPGVTVEDHTSAELAVTDLKKLNAGYWQLQQPNRFDKLRMLSQNMFSYHTDGAPGGISIDGLQFGDEDIFCPPELRKICVNWQDEAYANAVFQAFQARSFNGVYFRSADNLIVSHDNVNPFGFTQGLEFNRNLEIHFGELISMVELKMMTSTSRIIIHFCKFRFVVNEEGGFDKIDDIIETRLLQPAQLNNPIIYNDNDKPVNKLLVELEPSDGRLNLSNLHIGASTIKVTHFFSDEIDEVKLFKKELSPEEVKNVMSSNKTLPSQIAAWSLDETAHEVAGQYNGMVINNARWVPGVFNRAAQFIENGFILVPHHVDLSFGETNFSVSAWVKADRSRRGQRTIVEKMYKSTNGYFGYSLALSHGLLIFDHAFVQLKRIETGYRIADNEWHHIVVTVDRSYNRIFSYVDSELIHQSYIKDRPPIKGFAKLYELCYIDHEEAMEYENQISNIDVETEVEEMENGLTKRFQPIWRPNTQFAIQIETKDNVTHSGNTLNNNSVFHTFAFKTEGSLGHFHKNHPSYTALVSEGREDEYKLAKLQHYIDYDKSYPNADGKLIDAKPLFPKEVELLLFFRYPYVYSMFTDWGVYQGLGKVESALEVNIIDAEGNETRQKPEWNFQTLNGGLGDDIIKLNKFVANGRNCTTTQTLKPFGLQMKYKMPDLQPEKLYTAVFNSLYKAHPGASVQQTEVHKYVFQTSRYGSFKKQIESYLLGSEKAIFEWLVDIPPGDVNLAKQILNKTLSDTHALIGQYADPFDRLMNGALKLPTLNVAISTEFNIIKQQATGQILGILIRNPEPFNDPKLPGTNKQNSVDAIDGTGNNLKVLVAKEPSKIFISNDTLNLASGEFEFTFKYLLFDGSTFSVKEQEMVSVNI